MNELFSNPLYMFATIVVAVTIGVFAGGFFLKKMDAQMDVVSIHIGQ